MIKKMMHYFYFGMNLKLKLLLSYLILACLLISIFIFGSYRQSERMIQDQLESSASRILEQSKLNIEYRLKEMEGIANQFYGNTAIQEVLSKNNRQDIPYWEQLNDFMVIRSYLNVLAANYESYHIALYIRNNLLFAKEGNNFFAEDEIAGAPWYADVLRKSGKIHWLGYADNPDSRSISAVRVLKDLREDYTSKIGVLKIDMDERELAAILDQIQISSNAGAYLADGAGTILFARNGGSAGPRLPPEVAEIWQDKAAEGIVLIGSGDKKAAVVQRAVGDTGWRLVAIVPYEEVIAGIKKIRSFNMILLGLLIVIAAALIIVFLKGITKRVRTIVTNMDNIGKMKFHGVIPVKYRDELGLVESKLNSMTLKIESLIAEVNDLEAKKREAELRALQAQINPHFLYNTLDTINWMVADKGIYHVSAVISALGKFFRISLSGGRDLISIRDEIEHIKLYLFIQNVRFRDQLQVEYDIPAEVLDYSIIKLLLQPLVENAIKHGIQPRADRSGIITIGACLADGQVVMTVTDNGVGFDRLTAAAEQENDEAASISGKLGYGLKNIEERLALYFAGRSSIRIHSKPGRGTTVEIKWPAVPLQAQPKVQPAETPPEPSTPPFAGLFKSAEPD